MHFNRLSSHQEKICKWKYSKVKERRGLTGGAEQPQQGAAWGDEEEMMTMKPSSTTSATTTTPTTGTSTNTEAHIALDTDSKSTSNTTDRIIFVIFASCYYKRIFMFIYNEEEEETYLQKEDKFAKLTQKILYLYKRLRRTWAKRNNCMLWAISLCF